MFGNISWLTQQAFCQVYSHHTFHHNWIYGIKNEDELGGFHVVAKIIRELNDYDFSYQMKTPKVFTMSKDYHSMKAYTP